MNLIELGNKAKGINLTMLMEDAIMANESDIRKRNQDQLRQGKNAKGQNITPHYRSDKYAKRKQELNSQPSFGTPDLKVSGKLWDEIGVIAEYPNVHITSFDEKVKFPSILQYDNVFGLDKENQKGNRSLNNRSLVIDINRRLGL